MRINVMKDGDEVISVTPNYIAVKRCNGEVDLIPLVNDPNLGLRINKEGIVTIGYGNNEVIADLPEGGFVANI
ncbi:MAG: hypothetical protein MR911_02880 [Spirochaetia bacterium]|nr:hypothetical protein [uncultured Treponema sp.]MCI6365421.1 hypothetical protein [Spirochaetia bacterium]